MVPADRFAAEVSATRRPSGLSAPVSRLKATELLLADIVVAGDISAAARLVAGHAFAPSVVPGHTAATQRGASSDLGRRLTIP